MAEYVLTGSRSWDTTYAAQNGDGTGTFWANSFLPFFNRMTTLAYYLVEGGAVPASGASLNTQTGAGGASLVGAPAYASLPAGTLAAQLQAIVQGEVKETDYSVTDGDQTITETDGLVYAIVAAGSNRAYTLQAPTRSGRKVEIIRAGSGTNNVTVTGFANGTNVVFGATTKTATFRSKGTAWYLLNEWPE